MLPSARGLVRLRDERRIRSRRHVRVSPPSCGRPGHDLRAFSRADRALLELATSYSSFSFGPAVVSRQQGAAVPVSSPHLDPRADKRFGFSFVLGGVSQI